MLHRRLFYVLLFLNVAPAFAEVSPDGALVYLDFEDKSLDGVKLIGGTRRVDASLRDANTSRAEARPRAGHALEFRTPVQFAELPFDKRLGGLTELSVGGWFFTRRQGEQYFFSRGMPQIHDDGTRRFPPEKGWVNFVLGTDQRGFLMGTINGNGSMPFPYVTVNELAIDAWHQAVVVKDRQGTHHFYHNGVRIHSSGYGIRAADGSVGNAQSLPAAAGGVPESPNDVVSSARPTERHRGRSLQKAEPARPFIDTEPGEPIRLHMPHGGLIGEAWIFGRALTDAEVFADYEAKRRLYHPAHAGIPVALREMNAHHAAGLWKSPLTRANWPTERKRIEEGVFKVLGQFPPEKPPLHAEIHGEDEDCGAYIRRKVSFQVQHVSANSPDQATERMPCWLLVPKELGSRRVPAIVCFYGTTSGAGKDVTVGLSGRAPGTPPVRSLSFAIEMAEAGFVALAPDYLRDGERIKPGRRPYDTTDFYDEFPDWSIHGKDVWDTMRAIDYLETLDFVDPEKIGMTGHSYGGHSTIFAAALEPRIKVAVANGPVSDFLHHGMHWAVPKGGGASQSLPAMRPYVLDHTLPIPITFYEFTSLIAPRPLLVGQAAGERRPMEEENHAAVRQVYSALGHPDRVHYVWYAGDHDYPPPMRKAAVEWFQQWFNHRTN
jgi:dienelactone hydrolase